MNEPEPSSASSLTVAPTAQRPRCHATELFTHATSFGGVERTLVRRGPLSSRA